jgi:hypothetical protein
MPGYDGTGPMGMGPMTGGGMGYCAVPINPQWPTYPRVRFPLPYYSVPLGIHCPGVPTIAPEINLTEDLDYLKELVGAMREDLQEIEQKIKLIENKGER